MGNNKKVSFCFSEFSIFFSVYNIYLIEARSMYLSISIAW